jgi:predicted transcriptional regulator YheO
MKGASAAARKKASPPKAKRAEAGKPADVARERAAILSALEAVVPMLAAMVGDHVEVVLHDLTRPENSVRRIANGHITGRRPGSPVLEGPGNDKALAILAAGMETAESLQHLPVFPYPTYARDGRALSSGTVMFRDSRGETFAALCLNADFTAIEAAQQVLVRLLPGRSLPSEPPNPSRDAPDMEALMREIIDDAVRRTGRPVAAMSKDEKTAAVESMLDRGLFIVKGGVEKAAAALGVTRFTVYNYLDAVKARRVRPQPLPTDAS